MTRELALASTGVCTVQVTDIKVAQLCSSFIRVAGICNAAVQESMSERLRHSDYRCTFE
jgi:hypothetical protein